jgi:hypothetical protein
MTKPPNMRPMRVTATVNPTIPRGSRKRVNPTAHHVRRDMMSSPRRRHQTPDVEVRQEDGALRIRSL